MAIREFFHLIHIVNDEDEVDAWYDAVFSPRRFAQKHWLDVEKRWASLSMIGDLMLEVIEPSSEPADQTMALSKFRARFGEHFHSLAWYVDGGGIKPLFDRLRTMGVRIARPGGGIWPNGEIDPGPTIFTHPKDTFGQLEFIDVTRHWMETDPRFQPGWSPKWWADEHPLGIERVSHFTTIVTDLDRATTLYEEALGARVLSRSSGLVQDSVFVLVGTETVVELARPASQDSRIPADLISNGELPHSCTFTVRDLESVAQHMDKVGVGIADRSNDTLTLEPSDCFGAVYSFTTTSVPGDPRT